MTPRRLHTHILAGIAFRWVGMWQMHILTVWDLFLVPAVTNILVMLHHKGAQMCCSFASGSCWLRVCQPEHLCSLCLPGRLGFCICHYLPSVTCISARPGLPTLQRCQGRCCTCQHGVQLAGMLELLLSPVASFSPFGVLQQQKHCKPVTWKIGLCKLGTHTSYCNVHKPKLCGLRVYFEAVLFLNAGFAVSSCVTWFDFAWPAAKFV